MFAYLLRRLLWTIPVLAAVVVATFLLMRAAPGSPWDRTQTPSTMLGLTTDTSQRRALDRHFGLDLPLWRQFTRYVFGDLQDGEFVCGLVCGNLGPSSRQRGRTIEDILFAAPEGKPFWQSPFLYTLRLGLLSLAFALLVGIPLGVVAALRQDTWPDHLITLGASLGISVPNFVFGLLLIAVLVASGVRFTVAPRSWSDPRVWIIPVLVLGVGTMAATARLTRASLLEVLRQDYVRTARAKGLAERTVVTGHMLKNALIPVVTLLAPALAELVAGSFIVEMMFSFPGMGRLYAESVQWKDYAMVLAVTLLYAVLVTFVNLGADLSYGVLDPRIRAQRRPGGRP